MAKSDDPSSPTIKVKSPQSATWRWPSCNCSEEEFPPLLLQASSSRRPSIRRRGTDITAYNRSNVKEASYGATSIPQSTSLEASLEDTSLEGGQRGDAEVRTSQVYEARWLLLWQVVAVVLLAIAFAEGILLFRMSRPCSDSRVSEPPRANAGVQGIRGSTTVHSDNMLRFAWRRRR